MMPDTTFVFISGAGLQDYIWDNVIKELDVLSIAIKYNDKLHSLNEYVDSAMNQIDNSRARKIVIVAHSAGGVIAVEVAKRLGNKFAGFIAISAVIPVPSQSFVSSLPFPQKFIMPIILKIAGATPPESSIRNNLAKDLSIQNQDKIVKNYRTEGIGLYIDKTSDAVLPNVPSLYIVTTTDKEFTEDFQLTQAKNLHSTATEHIRSGHLPMISQPHKIAKIITKFINS